MQSIDISTIIEIVGYIGSALVVISMLMTSVMKLRLFNTLGSMISATYALIVHAYPLALMNILLILINVWRMISLSKKDASYEIFTTDGDSVVPNYIVGRYLEDIKNYFPKFDGLKKDECLFVAYNGDTAVGVTAGTLNENKEYTVSLDYTTPAYRDCSVGKYMYEQMGKNGVKSIIVEEASEGHRGYLSKVGFVEKDGKFIKTL